MKHSLDTDFSPADISGWCLHPGKTYTFQTVDTDFSPADSQLHQIGKFRERIERQPQFSLWYLTKLAEIIAIVPEITFYYAF
jgi:hypothetical protein